MTGYIVYWSSRFLAALTAVVVLSGCGDKTEIALAKCDMRFLESSVSPQHHGRYMDDCMKVAGFAVHADCLSFNFRLANCYENVNRTSLEYWKRMVTSL